MQLTSSDRGAKEAARDELMRAPNSVRQRGTEPLQVQPRGMERRVVWQSTQERPGGTQAEVRKKKETRWVERKKPKSQKQYDSTLGYPGEGPAEKLRMCTFNVNGLNEKGGQKMRDLMKWATEKTLDVIFIQEHNLGINKRTKWRNVCRQHGYCIIHGIHTQKTDMAVRAHGGPRHCC